MSDGHAAEVYRRLRGWTRTVADLGRPKIDFSAPKVDAHVPVRVASRQTMGGGTRPSAKEVPDTSGNIRAHRPHPRLKHKKAGTRSGSGS